MPTFNDSNNIPALLPEADYVFCVVGFDCMISKGKETGGSDLFEVELEIEPSGKTVYERLIDHKSTSWKIDTFLKSAGIQLKKGESFEFREDKAKSLGIRWINPLGMRGWCRITVEPYIKTNADGSKQEKKANKIAMFYVDKPKLQPREIVEEDKPF